MHATRFAQCTGNQSDYWYHLSVLNSEPCDSTLERSCDSNSLGPNQLCEHPIPADFSMPSLRTTQGRTSPFSFVVKRLDLNLMAWRYAAQDKSSETLAKEAKSNTDGILLEGRAPRHHENARLICPPRNKYAFKPATEIPLVKMMLCGHNIELSRPAASAQHQQFIQTQPVLPVDILGDGSNDSL